MYQKKLIKVIASTMLALPLILANTGSWGDEQLLSEVAVGGRDAGGDSGVVLPDLADKLKVPPVSYTDWVTPDEALDIRAVTFSTRGLIVLDGNVIREFGPPRIDPVTGFPIDNEKVGDAFPVDCTKLSFFLPPKGRGVEKEEFLAECSAVVALNDGTLRVLGKSKGNSFVSIAFDPAAPSCTAVEDPDPVESRTCTAVRQADGTPPQITDATNDESDAAATRGGPSYWALGERKKVIRFSITENPTDPNNRDEEQGFDVVATLNGLKLHGIAPYGDNQVIVADDDGRLLAVDATDGHIKGIFYTDPCQAEGRKTPQKFSVRGDSEGAFLYFANQACGTLTVLKEVAGMGEIVDTNGDGFKVPFLFDNDVPLTVADFNPEAITLRTGLSGDFEDCTGGNVSAACQFGQEENQARQFATVLRPGPDSSFRGFQFVLNDCRHSLIQPCPITNCKTAAVGTIHAGDGIGCAAPNPDNQDLDIMQLALSADASGEFRQLLDDPANPPVITLPGYLRAEDTFPPGDIDNNWTFYWFFVFTDAVFEEVFKTQYDLDLLRGEGNDLCTTANPNTLIALVSERANVIAYTPSTYNTIARPGQDVGGDQKGATVINSFCNRGGGSSFNWSGQVVGVEFTETKPDTFLDFTALQMDELQRAKDQLLCNAGLTVPDPDNPGSVLVIGRILSTNDCDNIIQPELDQMQLKLQNCHDSARVIQGNSAENCNALFTKIGLLRTRLDSEVIWPAPADEEKPTEDELLILGPNYEGEFKARLDAFEFALNDWFLPSIDLEEGIGNNPILDPIGNQFVVEGANLIIPLSATDPDGDSMNLAESVFPSSFCFLTDTLDVDGTGSITCDPGIGVDAGSHLTTVIVTNARGLTVSETFNIVVDVP